mmetsp:Transcript_6681/g.17023  ORF Transcript_6681/g.17023 Transcript_6681/m.17023 type:complete len:187 (-) Transcript_6681:542-1102(-)
MAATADRAACAEGWTTSNNALATAPTSRPAWSSVGKSFDKLLTDWGDTQRHHDKCLLDLKRRRDDSTDPAAEKQREQRLAGLEGRFHDHPDEHCKLEGRLGSLEELLRDLSGKMQRPGCAGSPQGDLSESGSNDEDNDGDGDVSTRDDPASWWTRSGYDLKAEDAIDKISALVRDNGGSCAQTSSS